MATLTVKNVGPIREVELEVKKYTVFIGPQGSGKSTLAKLIAIGGDEDCWLKKNPLYDSFSGGVINKYNISSYLVEQISSFRFSENAECSVIYGNSHSGLIGWTLFMRFPDKYSNAEEAGFTRNIYVPTERHIFPILSDAIWSLLGANINLPESVKTFGVQFEQARNSQNQLQIPFLGVRYSREGGRDFIYHANDKALSLSESASGYQAVIPLLVTIEYQRQQFPRRFIIEEPELNLYPTAQKDLIYNLVSGLDPKATYQDAEWVFTTHSPYVLSSLNTLILAYKVAHQSEENRAKVEAIIPSRHWINPDDFAAYYVDEGTVRSIVSETTGLISESELDDVSEDLAGEQDQLLDLYRSALHA